MACRSDNDHAESADADRLIAYARQWTSEMPTIVADRMPGLRDEYRPLAALVAEKTLADIAHAVHVDDHVAWHLGVVLNAVIPCDGIDLTEGDQP